MDKKDVQGEVKLDEKEFFTQ